MQTDDIVKIILGILAGGGGFTGFLVYLINLKKHKQNEFLLLISEYKQMVADSKLEFQSKIGAYAAEISQHAEAIQSLKELIIKRDKEIIQLRNHIMVFEGSHIDVPIPRWLKDSSGKVLFLNRAFEKEILYPLNKEAKDYLNKTDAEFWDLKTSELFNKNDLHVIRTKQPKEFIETWPGDNNTIIEGRVLKYPRYFANTKNIIGVGGMVLEYWVKE